MNPKNEENAALFDKIEKLGGKPLLDAVVARLSQGNNPGGDYGSIKPLVELASIQREKIISMNRPQQDHIRDYSREFLLGVIEEIYLDQGYIEIFGKMIHKSVIIFAVYSLIAAVLISMLVAGIFSATAWIPFFSIIGIVVIITIGFRLYSQAVE